MVYILKNWCFVVKDENNTSELVSKIERNLSISALGLNLYPFSTPGTLQSNLKEIYKLNPYYENNMEYFKQYESKNLILFCQFDLNEDFYDTYQLCFERIDTVAEVYLNGKLIGKTANYFIEYRFSLTKSQLKKQNNLLIVIITSALKSVDNSINLPETLDRIFVRRPTYNYGWDFAPRSLLMGIGETSLRQKSRIELSNLNITTNIISEFSAKFNVEFNLCSKIIDNLNLKINLFDTNKNLIFSTELTKEGSITDFSVKKSFIIKNAEFWWPHGYGDQPLYTLEIREEKFEFYVSKKCGIRSIKLLLEENQKNEFTFVINNKKIWAKGANWVPTDALTNFSSHSKYKKLLDLAIQCNFNMLRIWGGGVVEDDNFYDLCDELGILIWHDFQFACSIYPENENFLSNIKEELIYIIKKLRNHPSIVLWCGNNENEWIYFQKYPKAYKNGTGIGNKLNQIKEQLCKEYDPSRPFWRSSPWSINEKDPNSFRSGNSHDWFVWHGVGFKNPPNYKIYESNNSKFITEFGIQSLPVRETIDKIFSKETQKEINKIWEYHNIVLEKIKVNMDLFGKPTNIDEWIIISQLAQSMGLKFAIETWRSQKFDISGSLIWQFNEPWPTICWSLVDYFLIPKMSYYFVKRAYSSILPVLDRKENKIIIINDLIESIKGELSIKCYKFSEGLINEISLNIKISENNKHEIKLESQILYDFDYILLEFKFKDEIFGNFYFTCEDQEIANSNLPQSEIQAKINKENMRLELKSNDFLFIIQIPPNLEPDDNYFCLIPDRKKIVKIKNLPEESSITFLTWKNELIKVKIDDWN